MHHKAMDQAVKMIALLIKQVNDWEVVSNFCILKIWVKKVLRVKEDHDVYKMYNDWINCELVLLTHIV
jgi:hypothetical protein